MSKGMMLLRLAAILLLLAALGYRAAAFQQPATSSGQSATPAPGTASNDDHQQPSANAIPQGQAEAAAKPGENVNDNDDQDSGKPRHKTHFHLGTITLGASYTNFGHGYGPFYPYGFYPYTFSAFYTPFHYDPFYGPFYYPAYGPSVNYALGKGHVKLSSLGRNKDAEVYIDGAYAGLAGKLKNIWLDPGAYNLSVRASDGSSFQKRIYVLSGKTLEIKPVLKAEKK